MQTKSKLRLKVSESEIKIVQSLMFNHSQIKKIKTTPATPTKKTNKQK